MSSANQTTDTRVFLGEEHGWAGSRRPLSLRASDLLRHIYLIGQTGAGKSTTLYNTAVQLIEADECHRFTTGSLATILSESRKYGLGMVLASQYTAQLTGEIREAIFGNVGTTVAFRVSGADGRVLEEQFGEAFRADQFTELDRFDAYVKAVQDGEPTEPIRATMLSPLENQHGRKETIIRESRRRFGRKREVVE